MAGLNAGVSNHILIITKCANNKIVLEKEWVGGVVCEQILVESVS